MEVMLKRKMTILLLGLMCFSSISGFFTVICHGSDGRVTVASIVHNHCKCTKTEETGDQNKSVDRAIDSYLGHGHCKDTLLTSSFIVPTRKNIKLSPCGVFTANIFLKLLSTHATSFSVYSVLPSNELSSFFVPLRTVIILA